MIHEKSELININIDLDLMNQAKEILLFNHFNENSQKLYADIEKALFGNNIAELRRLSAEMTKIWIRGI